MGGIGDRMSMRILEFVFEAFGIFAFVMTPFVTIWGWVRWARREKQWTIPAVLSWIGFALAAGSALLAAALSFGVTRSADSLFMIRGSCEFTRGDCCSHSRLCSLPSEASGASTQFGGTLCSVASECLSIGLRWLGANDPRCDSQSPRQSRNFDAPAAASVCQIVICL